MVYILVVNACHSDYNTTLKLAGLFPKGAAYRPGRVYLTGIKLLKNRNLKG